LEEERGRSASPLALILASFFGAGFFPIAPATFATFILYLLLGFLGGWKHEPSPVLMGGVIVAVTGIGVWASRHGERAWGDDAGRIVIDEVAGGLITVVALPLTPAVLGLGFILFRVMDIVKPPPAYQLQSLPKGWGVMADDVMAGIYAHIALRVLLVLHVI
jgi:phosphatidylglycerophosphatase A